MPVLAFSKVTAQGQISVPAQIRKKLGVGPGSILSWEQQGDAVVVRRAGRVSSLQVHQALFPKPPGRKTASNIKEGIRGHIRKRHARD